MLGNTPKQNDQIAASATWVGQVAPNAESLSTLPSNLFRLMKLVGEPGTTVGQLSDFILTDPALLARVIPMLTASPLRGILPGDSLRRDIALLGRDRIRQVAFTTSILRIERVENVLNPETLWSRSLLCARVCDALARQMRHPDPDKAYVAGLLHDIGYLLFLQHKPDGMKKVFEKWSANPTGLLEIEREVIGLDHCEAGFELGANLKLDDSVREAIRDHHRLSQASDWITRIAGIASSFCSYRGIDFFRPRTKLPAAAQKELEEIIAAVLPPSTQETPARLVAVMESAAKLPSASISSSSYLRNYGRPASA